MCGPTGRQACRQSRVFSLTCIASLGLGKAEVLANQGPVQPESRQAFQRDHHALPSDFTASTEVTVCSGMLVPQLRQRPCSVLYCSTHSRAAGAKVAKNVMKKLNQASCDRSVQVSIGVRHKLRKSLATPSCQLQAGARG